MSDADPLLYDVQDHIATITLNRPARLNAVSPEMAAAWEAAIRRAAADHAVRVVLVTGADPGFCAGADIKRVESGAALGSVEGETLAQSRNSLRHSIQRVPRALQDLEKPYLAAVNGAAVGAGMDMASMADIRFASERARFGTGYVRMAFAPGDGGAYFLPRIIGMARALEWFWTGRIIEAPEALATGYVSRVVPHDRLLEETRAFAAELAAGPAVSIQLIKRLAYRSQAVSLHDALEMAEQAVVIARSTEDAIEGPRAFAEKRPPRFQGR